MMYAQNRSLQRLGLTITTRSAARRTKITSHRGPTAPSCSLQSSGTLNSDQIKPADPLGERCGLAAGLPIGCVRKQAKR